jgi:hypothetical protein
MQIRSMGRSCQPANNVEAARWQAKPNTVGWRCAIGNAGSHSVGWSSHGWHRSTTQPYWPPTRRGPLRIEKAFGVDMGMLLRLQAWHDAHTMRQRADEIDVRRYDSSQPGPG